MMGRRGRASMAATILVTCSALALPGCRRFHPLPLSPADTAAALERRTLADGRLREFLERVDPADAAPWPRTVWDLHGLTLAALYFHPDLAVARAQWQVAAAGVATAGARPNPSIGITPQYVVNSPSGVTPWVVAAALDWPVETAGKRDRRIERAIHLAAATRLDLDAAAWTVRANVRGALLDLVAARRQTALLRRASEGQQAVVRLLRARVRAGAASVADVATARLAQLTALADLAAAERQEAEARVALATAVGLPARALQGMTIDFPLGVAPSGLDGPEAELRRRTLQQRADVLAALASYAASQSALQLEIARQYPDVRIGPGYEYDQGLNKWATVGVSVELPVLNRNQGPIGEAEAQRTLAAARLVAVQATAIDQIDRALAGRDAASRALADADRLLAVERERLRMTRQSFEAGAVGRLELESAAVAAVATERLRLDAVVAWQRALGALEAAVQPPPAMTAAAVEGGTP
jgi:cobalt-zinc-cadmium efflux system outer membrane protein